MMLTLALDLQFADNVADEQLNIVNLYLFGTSTNDYTIDRNVHVNKNWAWMSTCNTVTSFLIYHSHLHAPHW